MSPSIRASLIFFFVRCGGAATSNTVYDLQYKLCSTDGGGDDLYRANVRQLLGALPSNAISNNGFYEGSSGSATDTADIPWPDQCQSCLQAASAQAPMACPSSSDADVAYRGCVLRYSGAQIPTDVRFDVNSSYAFHTVINAARVLDTDAFTEVRRVLFTDLASAAAASPLMMASGNRMFNATHNLYGLAQCNRDMRREQCSSSITGAIQSIQDYGFSEEMWSEGLNAASCCWRRRPQSSTNDTPILFGFIPRS
ncbi:hypothetical protein HU200_016342 [Digitaria exilis]|uniref:Gnk2-homologous domain-containing protein n=1 Tax=Digitaria exilis TaxID=1010633 RepID=A0A835F7R0_9POAL|nr:hypothetical protein HU200_016342 [Digitaria exilis]